MCRDPQWLVDWTGAKAVGRFMIEWTQSLDDAVSLRSGVSGTAWQAGGVRMRPGGTSPGPRRRRDGALANPLAGAHHRANGS